MAVAFVAGLSCSPGPDESQKSTPSSSEIEPARQAVARAVGRFLVPSSAGGWTLSTLDGSSSDDRQLLEVAVLRTVGGDRRSLARAVAKATTKVDAEPQLSKLLSNVLLADARMAKQTWRRTGDQLLERAKQGIDQDFGAWIGVLLNLTDPRSPTQASALRVVRQRLGTGTCEHFAPMLRQLPEPGTTVGFVVMRVSSAGLHCSEADLLFERLSNEPAWTSSILATRELRRLSSVGTARAKPARTELIRGRIAALLAGVPASFSPTRSELALAIIENEASRAQADWSPFAAQVIRNQVALNGKLPDSVPTAPSVADLAVQEWLAGSGEFSLQFLRQTEIAVAAEADRSYDEYASLALELRSRDTVDCSLALDPRELDLSAPLEEQLGVLTNRLLSAQCKLVAHRRSRARLKLCRPAQTMANTWSQSGC